MKKLLTIAMLLSFGLGVGFNMTASVPINGENGSGTLPNGGTEPPGELPIGEWFPGKGEPPAGLIKGMEYREEYFQRGRDGGTIPENGELPNGNGTIPENGELP